MEPRIAVFGASGFVGGQLLNKLQLDGYNVIGVYRSSKLSNANNVYAIDCNDKNMIARFLNDTGTTHIINTIGKAHDLKKVTGQDIFLYRKVNVGLTNNIAAAAKKSKAERLIFLSSSKIYGNLVSTENPSELQVGYPLSTYGITKYEGEKALLQQLKGSNVKPIIIRMPLVYGKNVKGNLKSLKKAIAGGVPLPLNNVNDNKRSLLSISNLYSFLMQVLFLEKVDDTVFNLKDEKDYSTSEILHHIMAANNIKGRTFGINRKVLEFLLSIFSYNLADKLLGNDTIDDSLARVKLNWAPKGPNLEDFKL